MMNDMLFREKVEMYLLYKEYINEYEKLMKEVEIEIKADLEDGGIDVREVDDYKVSWKTVINNRFDVTRFKKERMDDYKEYLVTQEVRKFKVA